MKRLLITLASLVLAASAQAASFDCAKAETKVEHLICDNPEISKLDDELSAAYKAALQDEKQVDSIKQAQKQWMKERNGCSDSDCVKRAYEERLVVLHLFDGKGAKNNAEQGLNYADDYVLDPEPKEMIDWNLEDYQAPQDKEVCSLYLQNLRYFARRNEPLSCGQPIAPMLTEKIRKVEWENLDPEKYPDFFKVVIKEARTSGKEPSDKEMNWRRMEIKERGLVFRRLKFDLKGYPRFIKENDPSHIEQEFNIVQYGGDVTNPNNPDLADRCHLKQGRVMDSLTSQEEPILFIVTKDMSRIYDRLVDWKGYSGQNLWLINDHIYGEFYNEKGDVKLSELRATDIVIHLESVCLFHFNKTAHKE